MTGEVVPFPSAYRPQIGEDDLEKVDRELASIDEELKLVAKARKGLLLRRKEVMFRYRELIDSGRAKWTILCP